MLPRAVECWAQSHFLLLQLAGPRATFYSLFPRHFPRPWLQMLPKALEPNASQGRGMLGPEPTFSCCSLLGPEPLSKACSQGTSQGLGFKCFPRPWKAGPRAKLCLQNVFLVASESDVRHCFLQMLPRAVECWAQSHFLLLQLPQPFCSFAFKCFSNGFRKRR